MREEAASALGPSPYPVSLRGHLDPELGRWRWLVKWFLAIPHLLVLGALWMAFVVLTVIAGVTIVCTGSYPRRIFDFNVGVMRWSWRVEFYAFSLATDRYPPFSLQPDPEYPADLDVAYPQRLSRGLVWVKWWLLVIPHYVIVVILGGTTFKPFTPTDVVLSTIPGLDLSAGLLDLGLICVLALIAGASLAVTRRYPPSIFDFLMGLHRWCWRVIAYASLMRDEYPPFRLDPGPDDPEPATRGDTEAAPVPAGL